MPVTYGLWMRRSLVEVRIDAVMERPRRGSHSPAQGNALGIEVPEKHKP